MTDRFSTMFYKGDFLFSFLQTVLLLKMSLLYREAKGSKFIPLRVDPILQRRQNQFKRVTSSEGLHFPLKEVLRLLIMKTCLFKSIENFTTPPKKETFSDTKI